MTINDQHSVIAIKNTSEYNELFKMHKIAEQHQLFYMNCFRKKTQRTNIIRCNVNFLCYGETVIVRASRNK